MRDEPYDDLEDGALYSPYRAHPRDMYLLRGTTPAGSLIGHFDGHDIVDTVVDIDGNRYVYKGLVSRRCNGWVDWESLTRGQYLVQPSFVYEFAPAPAGTSRPRLSLKRWLLNLLRFDLPVSGAQNVLGHRR